MKTTARALGAGLLALLTACGLVSSGVGTEVSESEAREVKARVQANFDEALGSAIRAVGGSRPRGGLRVYRVSCSDFTTRDISLEVRGGFVVTGQSVAAVALGMRRGWKKHGWVITSYEDPAEVIYKAGDEGVRRNVGSATLTKHRDSSGAWVIDVQLTSTTACIALPESLDREAWPTQVDDQ